MGGRRVTHPGVGRVPADIEFCLGSQALSPAEKLRVAAARGLPLCVVCGAKTKKGPSVCAKCIAEEEVR